MKRSFIVRRLTEKRAAFETSQVLPRQSFSQKSTLGQTGTHLHTHHNTAPRGLGHPADSILFPLNGSCVTKDNLGFSVDRLPAWDLNASLTDLWPQIFWCFVSGKSRPSSLSPPPSLTPSPLFLFFSSGLQRVSWEPGWLPR